MNIDDSFFQTLAHRLERDLPGSAAHEKLRAIPVGVNVPNFVHRNPPRLGSVLILLYREQGDLIFPLIKRTDYKGLHSGQISLPGGKREQDENENQTALRETFEEIGVHPEHVQVLGHLSKFHVIPSNFLVTPVVATTRQQPRFVPDPREVDRVIVGKLEELIREDAILITEILAAGQFKLNAPHFVVDNEIVWGATAMMLNELRTIVREIIHPEP